MEKFGFESDFNFIRKALEKYISESEEDKDKQQNLRIIELEKKNEKEHNY